MELSYAATQARRFDRDRFLCALFAPAAEREQLFVLLALNVELAHAAAVSEPLLGRIRLQWWRDALLALSEGEPPPGHPLLSAVALLCRQGPLTPADLLPLVEVRERDLDALPFADLDQLDAYAQASGGLLHRLLATVQAGHRDIPEAVVQAASQVGTAWALLGLMAAAPYLEQAGRSPIPQRVESAPGAVADMAQRVAAVVTQAGVYLDQAEQATRDGRQLAELTRLPLVLARREGRRLARVSHDPRRLADPRRGIEAARRQLLLLWTVLTRR